MISGFVRVLLININIFTVFCWSLIGNYHIYFNFRRGALAASSLVGSSVSSLVNSLIGSSISSSNSGYKYSFIVMVLKLVGSLISCTLHVSPSIPSNLNRPVYLLLCLILFLRYMSTSKLRGRS